MKGIKKISTKNMSHDDWLALRRKTIGGSDASAIVGLSKWSSPYSVWAEKRGLIPEKEDTEAMRQGRDLEDYVARRWMESSGKRVSRMSSLLYNPTYPFAHANIDRIVIGENAGLECKTTFALDTRKFSGAEFPAEYYAQCVHYLAVTGADRWYLAVLAYGKGFYTFVLERNESEIDTLMKAEAEFWSKVENGIPPTPDGSESSSDALGAVYPLSRNAQVMLFGRDHALCEYVKLKEHKKLLDARICEIENLIKSDMGEAESGVCDEFNVSWKSQIRTSIDTKKLMCDYPDIDFAPYFKTTNLRPFKVTRKS